VTFRPLLLFGFCFTVASTAVHADSYVCEVKQIIKLSDTGTLEDTITNSPDASLYKPLIGKTFVVDRTTGMLHGDKWFNTSESEKVTILSDGREENAFRVIYIGGAPASVTTFLYIKENAMHERKPFIVVDSSFVNLTYSGTCK